MNTILALASRFPLLRYPMVRIFAFSLVAVPLIAEAQVQSRLINAACKIADFLFTMALIVGIGAALWAAFQYMTAGGDATKVSGAHKTLTYAAIGIAVAILAGSVPGIVASLVDYKGPLQLCKPTT